VAKDYVAKLVRGRGVHHHMEENGDLVTLRRNRPAERQGARPKACNVQLVRSVKWLLSRYPKW
jgi:hypothetical protein